MPTAIVSVTALANAAEPSTNGTFRISRDASSASPLNVFVQVTGTATPNQDYTAITSQQTIPANQSYVDVSVSVNDDSSFESTETVTMTLQGSGNYTIGSPSNATVNIVDDETPVVTVTTTSGATEGGTGQLQFTRVSNNLSQSLTVNYSIGGTATSGTDFTSLGGSITFGANQNNASMTVTALADNVVEGDETIIATVTSGTGYTIGTPSSTTLTVTDDAPRVSVTNLADATEGGATGTFRFTRSGGDVTQSLSVTYSVGGTATASTDYTSLSGTVTFSANVTNDDVTVSASDDSVDEPSEWVSATIDSNTAYTIELTSAVVAISDNDSPVVTVQTIINAAENGGAGLIRFTRSAGDISGSLTTSYSISGTATGGTDYTTLSGSVTFAADTSIADIVVTPINDTASDPNETVIVAISTGAGYDIGSPGSATVTIAEETAGGISGNMWIDTNGDSYQDTGELGYGYRGVFLMANGEVVSETTTDSTGDYSFSGVTPGDYDVLFDVPDGFVPTSSSDGIQSVTVSDGITSTGISEGCAPPATFTATGTRGHIDWSKLDLSSGKEAIGPGGITGKNYNVKTDKGNVVLVFEANPAATQPPHVRNANPGLDIRFNCNGFSMNTIAVWDAKGAHHDFAVIDGASVTTILSDCFLETDPGHGKAFLTATPPKIVISVMFAPVSGGGTRPVHSVLMKTITDTNFGADLDKDKSTCDTKNGWYQLVQGATYRAVWNIYSNGRVVGASNAATTYKFFVQV